MAGHSKFKNIMHRKEAQDVKKARAFNRSLREIVMAIKWGGTDCHFNHRLRNALINAKKFNIPKDKIDCVIKKAANQPNKIAYEDIRYEGYGPDGIGIIIETTTNNKNRTVSEVRSCFSKYDCTMVAQGGVSYLFNKVVEIIYRIPRTKQDNFCNQTLDLDIIHCEKIAEECQVTCDFTKFAAVSAALQDMFCDFDRYETKWHPQYTLLLDDSKTEETLRLVESLDNLEDTQSVHHNLHSK